MTGENALAKKIFLKFAESFFIFQRLWKILICAQSLKGERLCTKKDKEYFVDSMNILGNCYFEQNRFADCIEVLQEICTQDYISYFVIFIKKFQNIKRIRINAMKKLWQFKKKADIHGISMDSDFKENKKISIDDTFFNYYSERFNFNIAKNTNNYFEKMNLVFSLYSLERYEEVFRKYVFLSAYL